MRVRHILTLLSGVFILSGCNDSTAPAPLTPVDSGWQMVIRSTSASAEPVYATKTDGFRQVSLEDFWYANSAVVDLRSSTDTVWIGYAIWGRAYREDFARDTVDWTFSGSMSPSNPGGVNFGQMKSLYEYAKYDTAYRRISGSEIRGEHTLALLGNDFQFSRTLNLRGIGAMQGFSVVFRPTTCPEFASRQLTSKGLTETQSAGNQMLRWQLSAPTITVTCNPRAPTSLRATSTVGTGSVRLVDYYKSRELLAR